MKELLDEVVKLYFDYPELNIWDCIEKAKEVTMDIQTLIKTTQMELDTKRNHFNNIYDDELAAIIIKEIAVLEEKLNYYYKLAKKELIA